MSAIVLKAEKATRGWMLRSHDGEAVVDPDGFTVWFASKAKAVEAAGSVKRDPENDWLVLEDQNDR